MTDQPLINRLTASEKLYNLNVQESEESFPIEYGTEYGQRKVGDDPVAGIDYALEALHKQHDPEAGIDFALEALHKQITQNIG